MTVARTRILSRLFRRHRTFQHRRSASLAVFEPRQGKSKGAIPLASGKGHNWRPASGLMKKDPLLYLQWFHWLHTVFAQTRMQPPGNPPSQQACHTCSGKNARYRGGQ